MILRSARRISHVQALVLQGKAWAWRAAANSLALGSGLIDRQVYVCNHVDSDSDYRINRRWRKFDAVVGESHRYGMIDRTMTTVDSGF